MQRVATTLASLSHKALTIAVLSAALELTFSAVCVSAVSAGSPRAVAGHDNIPTASTSCGKRWGTMGTENEPANAYIDRQRALARERQQRSRDRRRNGHVTIIDRDTGKPSLTLTNIAKNLVAGMNDNQALIQAGSSRKAITLIDKAKQGLAAALREKGLTISKVVDSTVESINATSPMLTVDGCIDRADWSARAAGRRDAIALLDRAGELPAAQADQSHGGVSIQFHFHRPGSARTLDVVDDAKIIEATAVDNTQVCDNKGD